MENSYLFCFQDHKDINIAAQIRLRTDFELLISSRFLVLYLPQVNLPMVP